MRLSSHLYFRTDGTIGRYPIIAIGADGTIESIEECQATMREMAHQQFVGGILVASLAERKRVEQELRQSRTPQEFASIIDRAQKLSRIAVGNQAKVDIIEGVNLNTFEASGAMIRPIV